jgi:hypothetical protein
MNTFRTALAPSFQIPAPAANRVASSNDFTVVVAFCLAMVLLSGLLFAITPPSAGDMQFFLDAQAF